MCLYYVFTVHMLRITKKHERDNKHNCDFLVGEWKCTQASSVTAVFYALVRHSDVLARVRIDFSITRIVIINGDDVFSRFGMITITLCTCTRADARGLR
jgi:hypothetical protein